MRCRRSWEPWGARPAGRAWKRNDTGWKAPLQWRWWAFITAKRYQTAPAAPDPLARQPAPCRTRRTRERGAGS